LDYIQFKANSLFISADATHAPNPNYGPRGERFHAVPFGAGVAVKEGCNGAFSFNGFAFAAVMEAGNRSGADCMLYSPRNGRISGGTIGPKVETKLGVRSIDIWQAMHSYREIVGWKDVETEQKLLEYLYGHYDEIRVYLDGSSVE
jgi:aspartyl aminopeptidase